jgi:drug/metabolite transporter (DMT)-like permease
MNNKRMLGNALLLLTAIIWGTAFVAQRVGMESIEPFTFNAARMALAAIVVGLVSFLMWRKECNASRALTVSKNMSQAKMPARLSDRMDEKTRYTIIGGISCGICLSAASITQQMGIVYTTAGKAGFITAMYMLLVPIIGYFVFGRKNTWLTWAAVLLGVVGMYLLCITEEFSLSRGDTLVCICAVFFQLPYSVLRLFCTIWGPHPYIRHSVRDGYDNFGSICCHFRRTDCGEADFCRNSDSLLWDRFRRNRIYFADGGPKVYRADSCIPAYESGICFRAYSRCDYIK